MLAKGTGADGCGRPTTPSVASVVIVAASDSELRS